MATMLPTEPRDFDSRSGEDIAFAQLAKIPDKDYVIIHSMGIVGGETESDNREADFVIYHPEKGCGTDRRLLWKTCLILRQGRRDCFLPYEGQPGSHEEMGAAVCDGRPGCDA